MVNVPELKGIHYAMHSGILAAEEIFRQLKEGSDDLSAYDEAVRSSMIGRDLYRTRGAYTYAAGWNWRAVAATLAGCALAWVGLVWPALRPLYDYAWFVGFGAAAAAYFVLMKLSPPFAEAEVARELAQESPGD